MKVAVIAFPGSNCDDDVVHAVTAVLECDVAKIWHLDSLGGRKDLVVLPGGFSYGDYLRSGAMAARSPIMKEVREHVRKGGLLLGICNGFQVLTEAGLLPGVLLANRRPGFICRPCTIRVERTDTPFTGAFTEGQVVNFPIAHSEGRYYLAPSDLDAIESEGRVLFRYCSPSGTTGDEFNPNGAARHIAGLLSEEGNILGLMPHPERTSEAILGCDDGALFWKSIRSWVERR
ncbi:MAG: phosphoribosylformylglycinamidine synthase subunit PurQ [Synergistales bacterium]|jgi:phosphoribosylformylglycinamidine synthase I|nr:phosphoribosylformylglycinamidine synthase subunit PurQ [Synergistales bacterium]